MDHLLKLLKENPVAVVVALLVPILLLLSQYFTAPPKPICNPAIDKTNPKIVTKITCSNIEDIEVKDGKVVLCRCWRSKNFPYCDGAHAKHNKDTGDNVGPIIIAQKE